LASVADILFNYLSDVINEPENAVLDIESLPEDFQDLGNGLRYFAVCVIEANGLAKALSKGNLAGKLPSPGNELAAPLKALHASLKHLTWQAQQIARGDYKQRVNFMGDFAVAFNSMANQLEERRKIYNQKLELQITKLKLAVQATKIGLWDMEVIQGNAVNSENEVIWSDEFRSMLGFSDENDFPNLRCSWNNRLHPEDKDSVLESFNKHLLDTTGKTPYDVECRALKKDGEYAYFRDSGETIRDENGNPVRIAGALMDITETKNILLDTERQRIEAEAASKAKSDFLARMTHEMRTPMNAIIGMSEIGKKTNDDPRRLYCFNNISEASQQLLGVIDNVLDISEMESENFELSCGEFNFANMLETVKKTVQLQAEKKNQKLTINLSDNIPASIKTDEKRLAQVITNILSNAVKFTPEHGSVSLSAEKTTATDDSCMLCFIIKDTGIGISEEQQKNLFKPFEQADGGRSRKYGGTGLGLAISKHIVDMMGGRIRVESEFGKGASFIFEINVQTGAEINIKDEAVSADETFAGKRILIAEDVEINREIISALLEDTGIDIDFAFNGREAYEKFLAASNDYGLIFMDIQMPEMDGYSATKSIRSSGLPRAEKIPIIAMTANVLSEDVESCIKAGMNGHLGKPVEIEAVYEKLRKHLY
jgi:PAS domain S-box-containing protein